MSTNTELAKMFKTMATILEIKGESVFKINAHTKVSRILLDMVQDITTVDDVTSIDGIGKSSATKIRQYIETGSMQPYEDLVNSIPNGLLDVIKVQGLGPKTVRLLWQEVGVVDLPSFRVAIESGALEKLPRIGKKTIENIAEALTFLESTVDRTPIGVALPQAEAIIELLGQVRGVTNITYAGSLRRGKETIGDIDILASSIHSDELAHAFCTMPSVTKILAQGETKCSVRTSEGMQIDLRIVDECAFGSALLYFTGSKEHNVKLREIAIKQGKRLNEYGLFEAKDTLDTTPIASSTEEEIYTSLSLHWIPPEIREARGELVHNEVQALIHINDIRCDLHCHTTASDGHMSIEALAMHAIARGFHTIAVTDHSQSSTQANGLKPDRLRKHIEAVHEINNSIKEITILAGSEVDILADGTLDYEDELLAQLDIVVASPHSALQQSSNDATQRLLRAIRHPLVHIIGHPTGRIINKRPGIEPDLHTIFDAAIEHNTALELNAHHLRLDLRDTHVYAAAKAGAMISINTDAHAPEDFEQLRYGIFTARRGWLTSESCVNCMSQSQLGSWLSRSS